MRLLITNATTIQYYKKHNYINEMFYGLHFE